MENYNIDIEMEYNRRKAEEASGYNKVFEKPGTAVRKEDKDEKDSGNQVGRPTMDDDERNSDPGKSVTGRAPKPSNEDGSEAQED